MKKIHSATISKDAAKHPSSDEPVAVSSNSLIGKAIETKKSIEAYFRGEITLSDLNAMGIEFV